VPDAPATILFVGDIVGSLGRHTLLNLLPVLRERHDPAFVVVDVALGELDGRCDHVLVDFHAEATSEKVALGWYLDGRVSAVVGTHTHVPTADARVLPEGTAYITDVGMTGPRGGVIGVRKEQSIRGFVTHMNERYETSDDDPWLMGVLVTCSQAMKADAIEPLLLPAR
jgi:metallophosphoesterase (TIGR00282 family)